VMKQAWHTGVGNSPPQDAGAMVTWNPPSALLAEATSKSWGQFVSSISENAELGTTLAEGRQALGMMTSRVLQLARFAKHLNRFEFEKARHDLELPRKKSTDVWSRDRTVASNFLEVHFGWSPLVSDIHSAAAVLTSDFKPHTCKGRGSSIRETSKANYPPSAMWSYGQEWKWQVRVQHLAEIAISNPNVALANQLGLINPVATLWETVPWSFVLDWFTNVGQCLSSWSDLLGYSVVNPSTTTYTTLDYREEYRWDSPRRWAGQMYRIERVLSLGKPTPFIKPFKGFSLVRGITAMSLLVQQLPKRPADRATPSLRSRRIYRWTDYAAETGQVPYKRKPRWGDLEMG
jgi:hypothetical protein